jgi:cell division protein FtsB
MDDMTAAAASDQARIEKLEARIEELEARIEELEREVDGLIERTN